MADAVEAAIEYALLAHAQAFATANSLTIALPNIVTIPPVSTPSACYLRATLMPAPSYSPGVGFASRNQHYGLLQLDVFWGLGGGEIAPGRVAADIIDYFERGTTLSRDGFSILVWKAPYRGRLVKDDPWVMLPVSIPYLTLASPPA